MTYIDLINDFWQEFEDNEAMKPVDALLYLYLLKTCNAKGWVNPFELSNKKIRICLGMTDKTIGESRDRLIKRGLIEATPGEKNRITPTYKLLRFCFPHESKRGSRKASKTESKKVAERNQNEIKTESLYIDRDIDKDYYIVESITREDFFNDFFKEERSITIEAICMNSSTDEATLRRLAKEVLDDWQATSQPKHRDLHDAQTHLLNQIRIKLDVERRKTKAAEAARTRTAGNRAAEKSPRRVNDQWSGMEDLPTE